MRELGHLPATAPAFPTATAAMAPLRSHWEAQGRGDFTPLWAGQNTRGCRSVPAAVVAYDHATGFGLLRPIGPLTPKPSARQVLRATAVSAARLRGVRCPGAGRVVLPQVSFVFMF